MKETTEPQIFPSNGLSVGDARFVEKNRICNDGNATYRDGNRFISRAKWLHRLVLPFEGKI